VRTITLNGHVAVLRSDVSERLDRHDVHPDCRHAGSGRWRKTRTLGRVQIPRRARRWSAPPTLAGRSTLYWTSNGPKTGKKLATLTANFSVDDFRVITP